MQTAVEYLVNTLFTRDEKEIHQDIIQQAKEMEKQQKINFATEFAREYIGFSSVCTDVNDLGPAAYYYNQVNK